MSKQKIVENLRNEFIRTTGLLQGDTAYSNWLETKLINSLPEQHKGVSDFPCMNDEQCDKQCELCKHVEAELKKEHKEGKSAKEISEIRYPNTSMGIGSHDLNDTRRERFYEDLKWMNDNGLINLDIQK